MFSRIFTLALATATAQFASAQAVPNATTVTGYVVNATGGYPISDATVYIEPACAPGVNCFDTELPSATTGPDGTFSLVFQALPDAGAKYTCWVYSPEGWTPAQGMTAIPIEKHATNTITFSLLPEARPQALTRDIEQE